MFSAPYEISALDEKATIVSQGELDLPTVDVGRGQEFEGVP
jgi:hypothetical protein